MYGSSAMTQATSWPWNRTLSVASTAWVSYDRVGIQARLRLAIISPVSTSRTPGIFQARLTSIERILAWASGLRRISMCNMPGRTMSST